MSHKKLSQIENLVNSFLDIAMFVDSPVNERWNSGMLSREIIDNAHNFCQSFLDKCKSRNLHLYFTPKNIDFVGHDLYLTANGHGAVFWDGDWSDNYDSENTVGDIFTAICEEMGMFEIYKGDDGLLYDF